MTKNDILAARTCILLATLSIISTTGYAQESDLVLISIVGTNDVHGEFLPRPNRGGLTTLSGYVSNIRSARAADGGAVLLIDAGDMWQGTLESNLIEGATIVAVYNQRRRASFSGMRVFVDWLRNRGGQLSADQFQDEKNRRWNLPDLIPATCSL
ncbi:MAG: hypothetical protein IIA07_10200 [Proteobacteria bacterium]|nr:hypothetical protein [Pseudomonadota bacterium]